MRRSRSSTWTRTTSTTAHLSLEERKAINWDHPNAFDWDLLVGSSPSSPRDNPSTSRSTTSSPTSAATRVVKVPPADVIVIDGILLFVDPRVRDLCDVKVFVDADPDIRLIRRIRRDMAKRGRPLPEILDQYLSTVQPMHLEFVEPSKRYADVIVPRGGHNPVAIEMIVAKIMQRLATGQRDDDDGHRHGERILVVDDEPDIVALVAYHLAKAGYRVSTASSGTDALDARAPRASRARRARPHAARG